MEEPPVLSVRNLSVEFGAGDSTVHAADDVSFDLYPGAAMGLVGESGSGKSVTALAVMGLLGRSGVRITSGEVLFRHPRRGMIDLLQQREKDMQELRGRHVAMIFQEPMTSLNPVKRCGAQIAESLIRHRQTTRSGARERTIALLGEVGLPHAAAAFRAWPHQLSGGQKQRVMIAMAMACDPSVLIADEPTTALDVTVQKKIIDLLVRLQKRYGMAVLFISHDLGVIRRIASRCAVMRDGSIVENAPVQSLFRDPSHPYTKALLACRPSPGTRPSSLAVVNDFLHTPQQDPAAGSHPPFAAGSSPEDPPWHRMARQNDPVLQVMNLQTRYVTRRNLWGKPVAWHRAVDDISFSVYKGETLGLVGESGCGKTTLGRTVMRLLTPDAGRVIYKGTDIAGLSAKALRALRPRFQIIFQDPYASLTPGYSIGQAIMEPLNVHGVFGNKKERKERTIALLKKVGLEERHFYRYPHELSGGQRQRVCIARALALNPEFLVCDECVSALDVSVQAQVLNLLNSLKLEFGLTYIFISHDLSVVQYMSDRIMVMKDGKLIETNDADALYRAPVHPYTKNLISSVLPV